jgi:hypothetical protein
MKMRFFQVFLSRRFPVWPHRNYPPFYRGHQFPIQIFSGKQVIGNQYPDKPVFQRPDRVIHIRLVFVPVFLFLFWRPLKFSSSSSV